jgi:hypothetical protein
LLLRHQTLATALTFAALAFAFRLVAAARAFTGLLATTGTFSGFVAAAGAFSSFVATAGAFAFTFFVAALAFTALAFFMLVVVGQVIAATELLRGEWIYLG